MDPNAVREFRALADRVTRLGRRGLGITGTAARTDALRLPYGAPASRVRARASAPGISAERWSVLLFAATGFASAFLIFLVQPLVAKRILPWFGGAPAVWSVCLAFYQVMLFAGYGYANLLITRANAGKQLAIHALAVGTAMLVLPVLPGEAWKPPETGDPSAAILALLLANVALPFVVLAATGPLVAVWFARRHPTRSPYALYAASNFGSLGALLAYPFGLEPRLALSTTSRLWSVAFVATGAAIIACAGIVWRTRSAVAAHEKPAAIDPLERRPGRVALWIALAACGVVILMGVTNALCLETASVPLLWMAPLAIYLVTLILCFGMPRVYRRMPYAMLVLLAFAAPTLADRFGLTAALEASTHELLLVLALYGGLLFATCMVLHGELYRLRPSARSLPLFYLCVAGGGAAGGLAVGLGAPRVFDWIFELPLGLALGLVLFLVACRDDQRGLLRRGAPRWRIALAVAAAGSGVAAAGSDLLDQPADVLHHERSFFGVLTVQQRDSDQGPLHVLMHGSTVHGWQLERAPDQPTSYYSAHTGVGLALSRREPGVPAQIGVIGLGAGALAAYGRAGDHMVFFEIDPAVIRLASDERYFTYLGRSAADVSIVEGDGRIALSRYRALDSPRFDYLIVDAFTSDLVPVHLLTREALGLYLDALQPGGLLAIHISSRYFDLMPVVSRLAADAGLHAVNLISVELEDRASAASSWVLLARDEKRIRSLAGAAEEDTRRLGVRGALPPIRFPSAAMIARTPLWTDDYSDLLGALGSP